MSEANALGWILAAVSILFMIWLALRAETRKARGDLETREERMLREMAELESTVRTLLTKLNESQREIDDLRVQLKTALQRIAELEVMYEIQPGNPTPIRLTPKRKLIRPLLVICGPDTNIVGPHMEAGLRRHRRALYPVARGDAGRYQRRVDAGARGRAAVSLAADLRARGAGRRDAERRDRQS